MLGFEPNYNLYFRGSNSEPLAMVEVSVFGGEDAAAFSALTAEICNIFHEIMNIAPDHVYVKYQNRNDEVDGATFDISYFVIIPVAAHPRYKQ